MKVKLLSSISDELTAIGLNPGSKIEVSPDMSSKSGACHFQHWYRGHKYECSIWPEDFKIISNEIEHGFKTTG